MHTRGPFITFITLLGFVPGAWAKPPSCRSELTKGSAYAVLVRKDCPACAANLIELAKCGQIPESVRPLAVLAEDDAESKRDLQRAAWPHGVCVMDAGLRERVGWPKPTPVQLLVVDGEVRKQESGTLACSGVAAWVKR